MKMDLPQWDQSKYSIHNDAIDAQHKQLFDIAYRAGLLINKQAGSDEIKQILFELFEYMKVHFADEEAYMDSIGYPHLEQQRESHQEIISNMTSLIQNIRYDFKQKLAIITQDWLIEHILKEDMQIEKWRASHQEEAKKNLEQHKEIFHIYTCQCRKEFHLLDTIHKKIQKGKSFHCKSCGQVIKFVRDDKKEPTQ